MTHPVIQDLQWRYTTKKYDRTKKVTQGDLIVILEALRLSASSINSQPWKFIVLESDNARQRLHNTFANNFQFNQSHILDSSHTILFAHNPRYKRENYAEVIDKAIEDGRTPADARESAMGAFVFAEMNTDENGITTPWTRAQTYIALGNLLHTLARLRIDSTTMEGIDVELVNKEFAKELDGYECHLAVAIGYRLPEEDYNAELAKSRRSMESVVLSI